MVGSGTRGRSRNLRREVTGCTPHKVQKWLGRTVVVALNKWFDVVLHCTTRSVEVFLLGSSVTHLSIGFGGYGLPISQATGTCHFRFYYHMLGCAHRATQ